MERYWRMTPGEATAALGTSSGGLTHKEARARLASHGPNEIEKPDRKTPLRIFVSQFQNPLVYILIAATIIAFFLADPMEALIIFGILFVNAILGFIQEYRSEKALEELRKYVSMTVRVVRDGQTIEVDVRELVPGDVVLVSIGDIVPADARLIEAHGLETNEAILTGESGPVDKNAEPLGIDEPAPHEMANMLFMGSVITAGAGKAVVVGTGKETHLGKSAKTLAAPEARTDFEKSIRDFGSMLLKVILAMTAFVFIVNAGLGHDKPLDCFLFALAIAVGITPELLPIIITIGLSSGAMALVRKHVAVKRLEAIEDLGNVDVLCADKTGTLTENQVSLIRYLDAEGKEDDRVLVYSLLCNSAIVQHGKVKGNTIDSAIWTYAIPRFDLSRLKSYRQIELVPFDYERKRMGVVVESPGIGRMMISKGAPECMLSVCSKVLLGGKEVDAKQRLAKLRNMADNFNDEGYRVIVVAYRKIGRKEEYTAKDEKDLVFMGFLILMDPPKKDALPALERFQKLGVQIYVLTGDSSIVTSHVCEQVGVQKKGKVMTGAEIAKMRPEELRAAVEKNNIYSRLTPSDKLAVVNALRANGHIVGFIGDGVNDVPSLKTADVGISVNNAADIAKDAADVVLLRKNLNVVANGISEGRKTFGNIIKYIYNTISANFGNMFTLTIASIFMNYIPLLPSQILFNNFLSDVPMLAVSTDNVDKDELRTPKRWNIGRITRAMVFFGLISSVFDIITMAFVLFVLRLNDAPLFRTVWFLESVLSEMFVVFALRTSKPFYRSMPSALLMIATILAAGAAIGSIYSPLASFFQFAALTPEIVAVVVGIVICYVMVVEIAKHIFQRMENHQNGNRTAGEVSGKKAPGAAS